MTGLLGEPYSSAVRPMLRGERGAVAAAHPLAAAAGQRMVEAGGGAVDAAIAAQAVLCVTMPQSCGLGGDMLALVDTLGDATVGVTGAGRAPRALVEASPSGANSVTVPGIVAAWETMSRKWGRLPLAAALAPAIALAEAGFVMPSSLAAAVAEQRGRLVAGGADDWIVVRAQPGDRIVQPALAALLRRIADEGAAAFYTGPAAQALAAAVARGGGTLDEADLAAHETDLAAPVEADFGGWRVAVQPPPTQGVLLAMALAGLDRHAGADASVRDHLCVELTEAAFVHRSRAADGAALLDLPLDVDLTRASRRGGPRAYLHTAGVAAADADGTTVSSLVSVFDDFGSALFVPELGITLNNRAAGFTDGPNAAAPGKRPVHTLAPALLRQGDRRIALSTPGADGQVQTLLQILAKVVLGGESLPQAVAAPRWRSEGGALLVEDGHPALDRLAGLGHEVRTLGSGDNRFGAVTCAAFDRGPAALADWRRECWAGVA